MLTFMLNFFRHFGIISLIMQIISPLTQELTVHCIYRHDFLDILKENSSSMSTAAFGWSIISTVNIFCKDFLMNVKFCKVAQEFENVVVLYTTQFLYSFILDEFIIAPSAFSIF